MTPSKESIWRRRIRRGVCKAGELGGRSADGKTVQVFSVRINIHSYRSVSKQGNMSSRKKHKMCIRYMCE